MTNPLSTEPEGAAMKRIFLMIKRVLRFHMTYEEVAEIAGDGPCRRCVGRALADLPTGQ